MEINLGFVSVDVFTALEGGVWRVKGYPLFKLYRYCDTRKWFAFWVGNKIRIERQYE